MAKIDFTGLEKELTQEHGYKNSTGFSLDSALNQFFSTSNSKRLYDWHIAFSIIAFMGIDYTHDFIEIDDNYVNKADERVSYEEWSKCEKISDEVVNKYFQDFRNLLIGTSKSSYDWTPKHQSRVSGKFQLELAVRRMMGQGMIGKNNIFKTTSKYIKNVPVKDMHLDFITEVVIILNSCFKKEFDFYMSSIFDSTRKPSQRVFKAKLGNMFSNFIHPLTNKTKWIKDLYKYRPIEEIIFSICISEIKNIVKCKNLEHDLLLGSRSFKYKYGSYHGECWKSFNRAVIKLFQRGNSTQTLLEKDNVKNRYNTFLFWIIGSMPFIHSIMQVECSNNGLEKYGNKGRPIKDKRLNEWLSMLKFSPMTGFKFRKGQYFEI